jgi:hypothetical protein
LGCEGRKAAQCLIIIIILLKVDICQTFPDHGGVFRQVGVVHAVDGITWMSGL